MGGVGVPAGVATIGVCLVTDGDGEDAVEQATKARIKSATRNHKIRVFFKV